MGKWLLFEASTRELSSLKHGLADRRRNRCNASRLGVPPLWHVSPSVSYPQDLMKLTAGEPVREECLKGLLNGEVVFAIVRGQVSPGDERVESCVGHANRKPINFVVAVPRATCW